MSPWSAAHIAVVIGCFVILAGPASLLAAEAIVDNTDAGFAVLSGTWSTRTTGSNEYGTNYRRESTATTASAAVQWQPTIPTAGDYEVFVWYPSGDGTHITDARYTVHYNGGSQTFSVNQQINTGQWVSLGTFNFLAGSSTNGRVSLTNQSATAGVRVYADAVRFYKSEPVNLTMAVSPAGAGTTTPAEGGPYSYMSDDVVSIAAVPAAGYQFSQWTVSAGANVADPASANTTVTMDVSKTVTAVFTEATPEFRGFWADVFHVGMQNAAQVDQMISLAVQGNYNAIVPEVLAFHDNEVGSHGAYWKSNIVARSSYVTTSFDPLAYMVQQAHANGLEVHCWLVAFRVSSTWPPPGNAFLATHPEWLKVPLASMGTVAKVGSYYEFDPGSPDVQDYLASIVRELVTDYEIDGIHWDYIRYTNRDSGYPADTSYENSSLKRFQRIYDRTDVPSPTGDTQWDDFRRRTVTETVRRMTWEIPLITSNPRQPVRYSSAVVTWYPCSTNFHNTRPYYEVFSDWDDWQSKAYLDSPVLMAYFDEDGSYTQTYRDWVDNSINLWRYNRQTIIGPGIYMNSFANSLIQMEYARSAGADGFCTYSYGTTNDTGTTWTDWYTDPVNGVQSFFTSPVPVPPMPWRDPATATEGTLYGRVTDGSTGLPVDDATVQVGAFPSVQTDGGGYYIVTNITASGSGTNYSVTATKTGYTPVTHSSVQVVAGDVRRDDLVFGGGVPPTITQHPAAQNVCPGGTAMFTVAATGDTPLSYRWQKNQSDLSDGGQYSGATTATLTVSNAEAGDAANYRCVVTNAYGNATSNEASLTLKASTAITQQPAAQSVCPGSTATFTVAATGDGTITYRWQRDGTDLSDEGHYSGTATATLTVSNADSGDAADFRCVVTAGCGSVTSSVAALTLKPLVAADFDRDCDVDAADYDAFEICASGPGVPSFAGCESKDFDGDNDVDQADFNAFQQCLSGENMPPDPACAG
ncbi:MAG: family 10 glycosylhydrolase [Phycisphaerae bacterium]|nr:family 10 glycosylhydrolase [Phycisphaerae bacterium]